MSSPTNQSQNGARAMVQAELKDICKNLIRYKELNNDQKDALMLDSVYLLKKTYRLENGEENSKEDEEWYAQQKELLAAVSLLTAVCRGNSENIKEEDFQNAQSVFRNSAMRLRERCAPAAENEKGEGSSKESGEGPQSELFSELEETIYDLTGKIMEYMDDFPLTLDKAKDEEGEYVMI